MEYTPKHVQPFTYAQAHKFETPTITEEITRLENSLFHLNRTQVELNAHLTGSSEEDRELLEAIRENEAVIGSQTERISMLKLVLEERGIITANSEHYDSTTAVQSQAPTSSVDVQGVSADRTADNSEPAEQTGAGDGEDGVYL